MNLVKLGAMKYLKRQSEKINQCSSAVDIAVATDGMSVKVTFLFAKNLAKTA